MKDIFSKIAGWKLWGMIGAGLVLMFGLLKARGDHYKTKAEKKEAELVFADWDKENKAFEAVQEDRAKKINQNTKEITSEKDTTDDDIYDGIA